MTDKIDITPHPRILAVLGDIEFAPWQCLGELIDNSFDDFIAATASGVAAAKPTVSVSLPDARSSRESAEVTVSDNGRGMDLEMMTSAIKAGWSGNTRHGSLGLFGMGYNIATARLGRRTTIRTTRAGDADWIETSLDLQELSRSTDYATPYKRIPKDDPSEHGTIVTIGNLKADQFEAIRRPATQRRVAERLGEVYSHLLGERRFVLSINGVKVKPRIPCIWNESRTVTRSGADISAYIEIKKKLTDKKACLDCGFWNHLEAETCVECGADNDRLRTRERWIWGWLGIQRYLHRTDYGIDFLRNGRKILVKDKRVFFWQDEDEMSEPEREYPIDAKTEMGRIVGEIHCDHVAPNYTKTAFEFDTPEWKQVIRVVRGDSPLRPLIAKRLGLAENRSHLARLYSGFRRQDPGLSYLVHPQHEKAREWAELFREGAAEYQSDELWYQAAYQYDNPPGEPPSTDADEILPGIGVDLFSDAPVPTDTGVATAAPVPPSPVEETLERRLQRYRDHAEKVSELGGRYEHPDLGMLDLTAWAVKNQVLVDGKSRPAPVIVQMVKAPRAEVFVDTGHALFREFGADMRDLAVVEVAEFMRVRAGRTDMPLTEIVADLKARTGAARLTARDLADEAERLLELLRGTMHAPVADDPASHWESVTSSERVAAERRFAVESGTGKWVNAIESGEFVLFAPASSIVRIIERSPSTFLDGRVFKQSYSPLSDQGARDLVVDRLVGLIGDLALLEHHRPKLGLDELARLRVSCRLVARYLADSE
ncbi:hypothetical protein GCM10009839_27820 [Catenulispora yoronensis]|uniref:ATP-binding protein n=1 Tax=Catenulispora yoronensis TaxID=450799 RepID=A0ABP5FL87_9ACTN